MHGFISSVLPLCALITNSGSARNGRAIETISASPFSRRFSATAGILIRFDATTGIVTTCLRRRAANANAARGTEVAMVGTIDSCQPTPTSNKSTPACSKFFAYRSISSPVRPPSTRSIAEIRNMIGNSMPSRALVRRTISSGNRTTWLRTRSRSHGDMGQALSARNNDVRSRSIWSSSRLSG
jgi:hypothetical protein